MSGSIRVPNKCKPTSVVVVLLFLPLKMANLSDLVGFLLAVTTCYNKETRVEISFSTSLQHFHQEIRITQLPNRTPDKLKG